MNLLPPNKRKSVDQAVKIIGYLYAALAFLLSPKGLALLVIALLVSYVTTVDPNPTAEYSLTPAQKEYVSMYKELGKKYNLPWHVLAALHLYDPNFQQDHVLPATTVKGKPYADIIKQAGQKYQVDNTLIAAVIQQESNWNPKARSKAIDPKYPQYRGARGLMQLMPSNCLAAGLDPNTTCFDPQKNIVAGTKMLSQLLKEHKGNKSLALAAYNAGSGAVRRYQGIPPYKETQDYVKKVTVLQQSFQQENNKPNQQEMVKKHIEEIAQKINASQIQHEQSTKEKNPTDCMKEVTNQSKATGMSTSLQCAVYSNYETDWDFVSKVTEKANQYVENPILVDTGTFTGGKIPKPAQGTITGRFGDHRGTHIHQGIDIANHIGTPIIAVADGIVKFAGPSSGYGYLIEIDHGSEFVTRYAHMYPHSIKVQKNQKVIREQKIAEIGNTGRSTGPHLHFEVRKNGRSQDPMRWIQ